MNRSVAGLLFLVISGVSGIVGAEDTITTPVKIFGYGDLSSNIAFLLDGKTFVSGSSDGTTRQWDVSTGRVIQTFAGHTDSVMSVAISPDGSKILTCTALRDSTARLWDLETGACLDTFIDPCIRNFLPRSCFDALNTNGT